MIPTLRQPRTVEWRRAALYLALATVLFFGGLAALAWISKDGEDVLNAYLYRAYDPNVVELEHTMSPRARATGDFDGDGVLDELTLEPLRREPIGDEPTNDLVRVRSGRTGEVLFSRPTGFTWSADWCVDLNGNGTDEVRFDNGSEPPTVLGVVAAERPKR